MDKLDAETGERPTQQKMHDSVAYSARMQEAMRHNRLSSSDYPLVMTILYAVSHGDTEEKWKAEQQQRKKISRHTSPKEEASPTATDDKPSSANIDNDYEQLVLHLKDLMLWPW